MAKPRKPKNEDAKADSSGPVVRHQKLYLCIDVDKRRVYGYTELKIMVPEIGIVGLHAENLGIESVSVNGEQTEFEYYPQSNHKDEESERSWSCVTSPSSAADAAGSTYISALQKELVPDLLINCCKAFKAGSELQEQLVGDNEVQYSSGEVKQNARYGVHGAGSLVWMTIHKVVAMIRSSLLHKILWLLALAAYYTRF